MWGQFGYGETAMRGIEDCYSLAIELNWRGLGEGYWRTKYKT
jgi:hypothetical protein